MLVFEAIRQRIYQTDMRIWRMRKYQKKQAEEFIEVLKEVHSAIIEAIKVNQRDSALDLL